MSVSYYFEDVSQIPLSDQILRKLLNSDPSLLFGSTCFLRRKLSAKNVEVNKN